MLRHSAAFSVSHHSEKDFASNSYWHSLYDDIGFLDHPSSFEAASSGGERGYLTRALWERLDPGVRRTRAQKRVPSFVSCPTNLFKEEPNSKTFINVQNGINVQ